MGVLAGEQLGGAIWVDEWMGVLAEEQFGWRGW